MAGPGGELGHGFELFRFQRLVEFAFQFRQPGEPAASCGSHAASPSVSASHRRRPCSASANGCKSTSESPAAALRHREIARAERTAADAGVPSARLRLDPQLEPANSVFPRPMRLPGRRRRRPASREHQPAARGEKPGRPQPRLSAPTSPPGGPASRRRQHGRRSSTLRHRPSGRLRIAGGSSVDDAVAGRLRLVPLENGQQIARPAIRPPRQPTAAGGRIVAIQRKPPKSTAAGRPPKSPPTSPLPTASPANSNSARATAEQSAIGSTQGHAPASSGGKRRMDGPMRWRPSRCPGGGTSAPQAAPPRTACA